MVSRRIRIIRWWHRTGLEIRILLFVLGVITLSLLVYWQRPEDDGAYAGSNLLVFSLLNINICFILILAFLVGRNVIKLVFDRRRNILGSRLRMRLVLAFVGLALVPTVLLYVLASGLLNQAMEGWFNKQVEESVEGSVSIARAYYNSLGESVGRVGRMVAKEVRTKPLIYQSESVLRAYLSEVRQLHSLYAVGIYSVTGEPVTIVSHTIAAIDEFKEPALSETAIQRAIRKGGDILREDNGANQFIRAYVPVQHLNQQALVLVTLRVSPRTTELFRQINDSFKGYEQIKLFKNPIRSGYMITLALITGLILFSAVWIGFFIARELTGPIQKLAEGTEAVARGDYDFQIRAVGDDEIGFLVSSFNKMTADLKQSRFDAERRRVLIETILASLVVGVIALDKNGRVTSVNQAAARLFSLGDPADARGKTVSELLEGSIVEALVAIVEQTRTAPKGGRVQPQVEIQVSMDGQRRKLIATAGDVEGLDGLHLGTVLIFDDITDLAQAQHMAAWRDVARRIAHEIKNPLTPLQLCAQRLQKLLRNTHQADAVRESTETIVEHVASIKRLADEFSKFARMPTIQYEKTDIGDLITTIANQYAETRPGITFEAQISAADTAVWIDKEQVRRAIINIIDNAVLAIEEMEAAPENPVITIAVTRDTSRETVEVEIIDTGPGIPEAQKNRIFEPYFTTRDKGTGLGLAIVSSIVADHAGSIRVFDNQPTGTRFVLELPVEPREGHAGRAVI